MGEYDAYRRRKEAWLDKNGILLCNVNPELPALEDIGATWREAMSLIDAHRLFYSKVYKKRTTYLSPRAYALLKAVRAPKPMPKEARAVVRVLEENPGAEAAFLKAASGLGAKEYRAGMDFLLGNLRATAVRSGRVLNENWSELVYGTAEEWERLAEAAPREENPEAALWQLVRGVMTEKQFRALTAKKPNGKGA